MFTTWLAVVGISVLAVAFLMLGMSLALFFKGHFLDNDISTNHNMRKMDIKCAVQQSRIDQQGVNCHAPNSGCYDSCAACDITHSL